MSIKPQIIRSIRFITGKRFVELEKDLDKLSQNAQRDLLRFLKNIDGIITSLKKRKFF